MTRDQVIVGTRVRALREFSGVPLGTHGVIDEIYSTGCMVAWDLRSGPLPPRYSAYDGKPMVQTGILRDGFDFETELGFLAIVESAHAE